MAASTSAADVPAATVEGSSWADGLQRSFHGLLAWLPVGASPHGGQSLATLREEEAEQCLERMPVELLCGEARRASDLGPLLLVLPDAVAECEATALAVTEVFRHSGVRGVMLHGSRLEAERWLSGGLADSGAVSDVVVFAVRSGESKTCCYCGDAASWESLSFFVASIMHADYFIGAAAFLRPTAFVRLLCPDSLPEVVGARACRGKDDGSGRPPQSLSPRCRDYCNWARDAEPACAILVSRSSTPAGWFVEVSRIFSPRLRFGLASDSSIRKKLGIRESQLNPKSPSNPSNQNYLLLFLPQSSSASPQASVVQYRGEAKAQDVASFLAACLRSPGSIPKSPANGAWVALAFRGGPSAAQVRERLRLLAVQRFVSGDTKAKAALVSGLKSNALSVDLEAQRRLALDLSLSLSPHRCAAAAAGADPCGTSVNGMLGPEQKSLQANTCAVFRRFLPDEVRGALWQRALEGRAAELRGSTEAADEGPGALDFQRHLERLQPLLERRRKHIEDCERVRVEAAAAGAAARCSAEWVRVKTPRTDDGTQGRPRCAVADEIKAGDVDTLSMEKVDTPSDCSELDDNLGAQWLHVHAGVGEEGAECGVCDVEDGEAGDALGASSATSRDDGVEEALAQLAGMGFMDANLNRTLLERQLEPAEEAQWASNSDDTSGETGARGEKRIGKSELQQVVNHLLQRSQPPSPCAQQMRCAAHNAQPSTEDQSSVPPGEAPSPFASAQATSGAADTTDEETVHQISLDLERTFPGLILLQANQGALYAELRAVLFAVACERARLGYVQGMSHLAALLLLYMPACDAFVSLVRLLDTAPHLAPFFHVDMEEISRFAAALHVMLAIHRPAIAARIRRTGVDARLFVLKWWITCFVSVFPPHHVSCLWDRFLCQGISSLVCFTMALLEHVCAVHSTHMNQWDKALSLLTHIEDYDIDMDAVFAGMDELQEAGGVGGLLPINDETFMDLVTNPTPRAPPDDAAAGGSIVGLHVPCRIGLRVELLDKIALVMADEGESVNSAGDREALAMPALESQGIGTVTQVEQEGAVVVAWDNGNVHSCRAGLLSEFWLKLSFADFG